MPDLAVMVRVPTAYLEDPSINVWDIIRPQVMAAVEDVSRQNGQEVAAGPPQWRFSVSDPWMDMVMLTVRVPVG